MEEPLKPEVVEPAEQQHDSLEVTEPSKLIRIASMTRAMLNEAREAPLDDGGRQRMAQVHARSVDEQAPRLNTRQGRPVVGARSGSSQASCQY